MLITILGDGRSGTQIPAGGKFFLISKSPDRLCGPFSLLLNGNWCPFLYVKREGRAFVHCPLSSAQVKNE
jgi:hypothetical protein